MQTSVIDPVRPLELRICVFRLSGALRDALFSSVRVVPVRQTFTKFMGDLIKDQFILVQKALKSMHMLFIRYNFHEAS